MQAQGYCITSPGILNDFKDIRDSDTHLAYREMKRSSLSSVATGKDVVWRKVGSRAPCTTEVKTS